MDECIKGDRLPSTEFLQKHEITLGISYNKISSSAGACTILCTTTPSFILYCTIPTVSKLSGSRVLATGRNYGDRSPCFSNLGTAGTGTLRHPEDRFVFTCEEHSGLLLAVTTLRKRDTISSLLRSSKWYLQLGQTYIRIRPDVLNKVY